MEQILDILYTIPNPLLILPGSVIVFGIPGLITYLCFKSITRCKVVYTWTFASPIMATLLAGLVIYLFVGPLDEYKTEELAIISLYIGIPCGWLLGVMFPVVIYFLNDRKLQKKINAAQPLYSPYLEPTARSPQD